MTCSAPSFSHPLASSLTLPMTVSGSRTSPPPSSVTFRPQRIAAAYAAAAEKTRSYDTCVFNPKLSSSSSFYQVLGIPMGASDQEIKAAYRRLARTCHPDVVTVGRKDQESADEFIRIHAAYSTLSDPQKRADYDRSIFRQYKSAVFSGGYTTRNWETDQCW